LEEIQKKAFEEGFAQGKKEGFEYGHDEALAEGQKAMHAHTQRIEALLSTLDTPFMKLDEQVEQELVTLVITMVRQLVRREVRTDPGQIIGVVREAMAILPVASRNVQLILHPEDAELVREIYSLSETELGWNIIEDPVTARGGCKVVTDTSLVDATLESRLTALIAPLLGGERSGDTPDEGTE
jgi:flagellar assembly protein FliH